jgi:bile acid:Na+ symporter, BASS family
MPGPKNLGIPDTWASIRQTIRWAVWEINRGDPSGSARGRCSLRVLFRSFPRRGTMTVSVGFPPVSLFLLVPPALTPMIRFSSFAHFLHARLLWLLLAVYIAAALLPGPALALRAISFAPRAGAALGAPLTLPALLLAVLLFNAGFGTRISALRYLGQSSLVLGAGTLVNLAAPVLAILAASLLLRFWDNPVEAQNVLTGMVLIASMPIAGSSTAWAQNAEGDLTVSLGLVLLSTALSPWTTPLLLHAGSCITSGDWSHRLSQLAGHGSGDFLLLFVLAPSLAGMLVRAITRESAVRQIQPTVKIANTVVLLLLCYLNAAVSLPHVVAHPDAEFLAMVLAVTLWLCLVMFGAGWFLACVLRLERARQVPLIFGLGMNNNGTGLVVGATAMQGYPLVLLPILVYNLLQHLAAGVVDRLLLAA